MRGQRATIRIIADEYLREQRMNKYTYEVGSRSGQFRGYVDVIYSDATVALSAGHTYHVRFNSDTAAPRILKSFREVDPS